MAETLISPGVLARENDQSQITSQPVQAGAAIVGPTVKGQTNIPTVVTSYSEYLANFGSTFESGSDTYSFLTSISAYNYFQNGGESLLVTRVQSGTFSSATSSFVSGTIAEQTNNIFTLESIGEGANMNSDSVESSTGALPSGSADNLRWEIVSPNKAKGVFSVIIRRGDDNTKSKSVLESFTNVSLDPKQPNYIARVIGDQNQTMRGTGVDPYLQTSGSFRNASRYVRVKSVNVKTPDYFDNSGVAKLAYTASIPVAQSGAMGDASGNIVGAGANYYENISTNTQGLVAADYSDALGLLANADEFQYNIISTPGLIQSVGAHGTTLNTLVSNVESRGDAIVILDLATYSSTIASTVQTADGLDTSYAASYWPWCQITDPDTGKLVWVPASTLIPGVYAANDATSEAWFAPAGINRGGMGNVVQVERKLTSTNRDELYTGKVNPIATFPGRGVVVFGQKTLQTQASALDRVNVRRLLIELKSYISQVSDNLVFEQNSAATRNTFLGNVNPYLESVQQRQGLYAFKVVMDESNNTADVIDRNQLVGAIYIQPTKTAEFIYLDFNILPTGATFPA
jgi:phage tail sheath protein FI